MSLLQIRNLSKSYGGVRALKDVSVDIDGGEIHALVGENGAGKSTLIKAISGAVVPDTGTVLLDGQPLPTGDPLQSRRLGVAVVYQQPALFADLTVAENLALRLEAGHPWRVIDWGARVERAGELLARVGAKFAATAVVRDLSMPEQQLVEIAAAIGGRAKVLILDEPTASLSERECDNLFALLRQLRGEGTAIVYISHRLEEVEQLADRVTVLRDGTYVGTRAIASVDRAELIRLMVGRDVAAVFPKRSVERGAVVMEVRSLGSRSAGVTDVSFAVRAGEILGLAGLVGAGRTELARVLFGLTPADSGAISVQGRDVRIASPQDAVRHGIAYVPEDRRRHGVLLDFSVAQNTTLAILRRLATAMTISASRESQVSRRFVDRLSIKTRSIDAATRELSGGNQQKVALARWLATEPRVLILDEPTQGIDVGAKAEIHALMGDLAAGGMGIVMISSEMPEILGMSDRVAVMRGGRIVQILDRSDATQERVLDLALAG